MTSKSICKFEPCNKLDSNVLCYKRILVLAYIKIKVLKNAGIKMLFLVFLAIVFLIIQIINNSWYIVSSELWGLWICGAIVPK